MLTTPCSDCMDVREDWTPVCGDRTAVCFIEDKVGRGREVNPLGKLACLPCLDKREDGLAFHVKQHENLSFRNRPGQNLKHPPTFWKENSRPVPLIRCERRGRGGNEQGPGVQLSVKRWKKCEIRLKIKLNMNLTGLLEKEKRKHPYFNVQSCLSV